MKELIKNELKEAYNTAYKDGFKSCIEVIKAFYEEKRTSKGVDYITKNEMLMYFNIIEKKLETLTTPEAQEEIEKKKAAFKEQFDKITNKS